MDKHSITSKSSMFCALILMRRTLSGLVVLIEQLRGYLIMSADLITFQVCYVAFTIRKHITHALHASCVD